MPRSIARQGWLRVPVVREWRNRLVGKYVEETRRSLLENQPQLFGPDDNPILPRTFRRELLHWGRTGIPAKSRPDKSLNARRAHLRLIRTRRHFCAALDEL